MTSVRSVLPLSGLSLIVPLFDEEHNVEPLAAELAAVRRELGVRSELILVDDGSADATGKALRRVQQEQAGVRLLEYPSNRGQSAAIAAAVYAARMSHVATLDGDLQNDPRDLLRMLPLCAQHDAVIGRRVGRRDPPSRRAAAWIANSVRGSLLGDRASDSGCALKIFPRELFLALPAFDGMHRFLPALFRAAGASVCEVGVSHRPRLRGRSKYTNLGRLRRTLPDLLGVIWLTRRRLRQAGLREHGAIAGSAGLAHDPRPRTESDARPAEPAAQGSRL